MQSPAKHRLSVEIWEHILNLCISGRISCYDNNNIGLDIQLFPSPCRSAKLFIEAERIRMNLRGVCQSWNRFLMNKGFKLVRCYMSWDSALVISGGIIGKLSQRIELICGGQKEVCRIPCWQCEAVGQLQRQEALVADASDPELEKMEAILAYHQRINYEALLSRAPQLRLLSWWPEGVTPQPSISALNNLQHLSHLYIRRIGFKDFFTFSQTIALPTLSMLSIEIIPCFLIFEHRPLDGLKNRLPSLNKVHIIDSSKQRGWEQEKQFIIACAETIEELVFELDHYCGGYDEFMQGIVDRLPHLTLYGTNINGIRSHVEGVKMKVQSSRFLVLESIYACSLIKGGQLQHRAISSWVGTIILDETWPELRNWGKHSFHGISEASGIKAFLMGLTQTTTDIKDIAGVSLSVWSGQLRVRRSERTSGHGSHR